jgi:hypothetical protein
MKNDADDDLEAWLAALAGRSPPSSSASNLAAREGALLRRAVRANLATSAPVPAPLGVEDLLDRARAAGLLAPDGRARACAACERRRVVLGAWLSQGRRWLSPWGWGAALAGVLGVASLVLVFQPPVSNDVLRGPASDGVVLLDAAQPGPTRDQIAAALAQAGAVVHAYDRLGRAGLDIELSQPPTTEQLAVLARHGLKPGAEGVLRLEVVPRPSRPGQAP